MVVKGWGRRGVGVAVAAAMLNVSACGYLMFPERVGQPTGGKLDVPVVVLDAVGLLFGIIPGVIAFAVDLGTGCIYLPPDQQAALSPPATAATAGAAMAGWQPVAVVAAGADLNTIAAAVEQQLAAQGRLHEPLRSDDILWQAGLAGPVLPLAAR